MLIYFIQACLKPSEEPITVTQPTETTAMTATQPAEITAITATPTQDWYALGERYYRQGHFPLSLEAHLHNCKKEKSEKSLERIDYLLTDNRYTATEAGQIMNKDSLLLLYDPQRREKIATMISDCGFKAIARVKPAATFRNFKFDSGNANLHPGSEHQLEQIVAALWSLSNRTILIHGHTDTQPWKGVSEAESDRRNQKLSEERADTIARALEERGISRERIEIYGYGYRIPLVNQNNPAAWNKNRRVEIEVK